MYPVLKALMLPWLFFVCDKSGDPAAPARGSLNERICMKEGSLFVYRNGRLIGIKKRKRTWDKRVLDWIRSIERVDVLCFISIVSGFLFAYWLNHR